MTRNYLRALVLGAAALGLGASAAAQTTIEDPIWDLVCIPADATTPYSDDYNTYVLENDLFGVTLGIAGTVNYGACWSNYTANVRGRVGFSIGTVGSIQDELDDQGNIDPTKTGVDNSMRLTHGMPLSPHGCTGYGMIVDTTAQNARAFYGSSDITTAYVGASNRYCYTQSTAQGCLVTLQIDLTGDAARLQWTLQSTSTTAVKRALWFGQWVTMLRKDYSEWAAGFVSAPGSRPIVTYQTLDRLTNPQTFPDYVDFGVSQTEAYGLEILNGATSATTDNTGLNSDQSTVNQLLFGEHYNILGWPYDTAPSMPGSIIPDHYFINPESPQSLDRTAYIQKFETKDVPASTVAADTIDPQFVAYYKSVTGNSNYALPYSAVVDAPKLIQVDSTNPNKFLPNPSRIRVYIDNVGGFGKVYREFDLEGVKVQLNLPQNMFEYNTSETDPLNPTNPNRTISKTITRIAARTVGYVDFLVGTNKNAYGPLTYQVKITPVSTVAPKTLTGTITVASQPRLQIRGTNGGVTGANLVSPPWQFESTSWETILSGSGTVMQQDRDFRAFSWDPQISAYIPSTGPERSKGFWILSKQDLGYFKLGGNPHQPTDLTTGAPSIQLKNGWNLIGNPYNYAFPLYQANGVSGADQKTSNSFQELVDQGVVSGSLAYWDPDTQTYKFSDVSQDVQPNRGYWIYVATPQDLSLVFPPVYQQFLRSTTPTTEWVQSDKHYRLQIAARGPKSVDDQNFVGVVQTAKEVTRTQVAEPPTAPVDGAVTASITGTLAGKATSMAAAYSDKAGRQEWTVNVYSKDAGQVTVTWPNLSTLPKSLKLRLVDTATNTTRDMRRNSGYTFTTTEASTTRAFKVQIEQGTISTAKIGSVTVSHSRGDVRNSPINVAYTLTSAATTTVRIIGSDGREIYVASRGRAEVAGLNQVTWNLRDSANRAVPPGTYRVEIVAETTDGERVRRIVPVTVVR